MDVISGVVSCGLLCHVVMSIAEESRYFEFRRRFVPGFYVQSRSTQSLNKVKANKKQKRIFSIVTQVVVMPWLCTYLEEGVNLLFLRSCEEPKKL